MKKDDWKPRNAIERALADNISKPLLKRLLPILPLNSLDQIIEALKAIADSPEWQHIARASALQMVKMVGSENARTWREAARQGQRSREIHAILKQEFATNGKFARILEQNAALISSLPDDIARHISERAGQHVILGVRAESLLDVIRAEAPHLTRTRARLIARTETAKAQAAITQIRAEHLGIDWYIWRTCQDARVRSSHEHMENVLCRFSNPPSPEKLAPKAKDNPKTGTFHYYGPGGIWNCRCYAEPVIDVDFIDWPHKVCRGDNLHRMSKRQFEEN